MVLQAAKCTNCGAILDVDPSKDAAICQFCGSAFIVEKAINNYTYHVSNEIHAEVVNVFNTSHDEYKIRAGRLLEYRGASVDAVIPNGVFSIGPHAIAHLDMLKSVIIPEGVELIENSAFEGCKNLISVTIPASVKRIAPDAFALCNKIQKVDCPLIDKYRELFVNTPFYYANFGEKWKCFFCDHINPPETEWCQNCNCLKILF